MCLILYFNLILYILLVIVISVITLIRPDEVSFFQECATSLDAEIILTIKYEDSEFKYSYNIGKILMIDILVVVLLSCVLWFKHSCNCMWFVFVHIKESVRNLRMSGCQILPKNLSSTMMVIFILRKSTTRMKWYRTSNQMRRNR